MTALAAPPASDFALAISRESLREAIDAVGPATGRGAGLPIARAFLLAADDNSLTITATDFDHRVSMTLTAEVKGVGSFVVPADPFSKLVRELPEAPVSLSIGAKNRLTVKCGKVKSVISGIPVDEFPLIENEPMATACRLNVKVLRSLIDRVTYAVASKEGGGQFTLEGAQLETTADRVSLVACDRYQFAIARAGIKGGTDVEHAVINVRAFDHVGRCFGADEDIEIARGENSVMFRGERATVVTRPLDGKFPNYEHLIPKDHPIHVFVDRLALLGTVRRTLAVIGAEDFSRRRIRLAFNAENIVVTANDQEVGSLEDFIPCQRDGKEITLMLNATYLADTLRHITTAEVRIELKTPEAPVLFFPNSIDETVEHTTLIMPVRDVG